jgi:hypothetical protein
MVNHESVHLELEAQHQVINGRTSTGGALGVFHREFPGCIQHPNLCTDVVAVVPPFCSEKLDFGGQNFAGSDVKLQWFDGCVQNSCPSVPEHLRLSCKARRLGKQGGT